MKWVSGVLAAPVASLENYGRSVLFIACVNDSGQITDAATQQAPLQKNRHLTKRPIFASPANRFQASKECAQNPALLPKNPIAFQSLWKRTLIDYTFKRFKLEYKVNYPPKKQNNFSRQMKYYSKNIILIEPKTRLRTGSVGK
ncbi:MAG: hypothetical protein OEM03_05360 [Chromatiales bacterium]|nr:hypothetical protein [Chromatiales bacterium]